MKQYRITKIIFAKDIAESIKKEREAEIVSVDLNEEVNEDDKRIGFK